MINVNKAEIIGLLCAEGNYYDKRTSYFEYYKDRKKYYYKKNKRCVFIQFGNFDKRLLKRFQILVQKEYNYCPPINKDRVRICKRDVIKDLLNYSNYGCLLWDVPSEIMSSEELMCGFLRGYLEGDGSVKRKIRFSSANINGLKKVKYMLDSLGIKSGFNGPYIRKNKEPQYEINIYKESWEGFFVVVRPPFKTKIL